MRLEQNWLLHSISATSFPVIGSQSLTICSLVPGDVVDTPTTSVNRVTGPCGSFDSASNGLWGGRSPVALILGGDDGSDGIPSDGEVFGAVVCPVGLKANALHLVEAKSLPEVVSRTIIVAPSTLSSRDFP